MTFVVVTALFFSWALPTLFRGNAETAATLVPVRATSRASPATTIDGDGLMLRRAPMGSPFSG
ncbi:MAG: hypothetical protein E6G20_12690 [Actinobacteria bacterium]|nr:MAG: hypothetical protein E6G28_07600 [Actinomycetota bacterium]TML45213.1 MAG: hypothetical protein E6G20_12690 [Actinomycetota bacterium]